MLDVLLLFPSETDATRVNHVLTQQMIPQLARANGVRSLRLSEGTVMSRGGPSPYSRVLQASFDSLADWMAVVDALNAQASTASPAERETFDRLAPLVVFYEVSEQTLSH
jgi:hypothetical protein